MSMMRAAPTLLPLANSSTSTRYLWPEMVTGSIVWGVLTTGQVRWEITLT